MPTCPTCGANLSPDWKFCIYCGSPVPTAGPWRSAGTGSDRVTDPGIPGAIRLEQTLAPPRRRAVPVMLAVVLAIGGTVAVVTLMLGMLAR